MANIPLKTIKFPGLDDTYTVPQVDNTLSVTGAAADAKKTGDEISELNERIDNLEPGLSDDAKAALLACFRHVAFLDDDADYYGALESALYADDYPRISAVFNPGSNVIYTDNSLDSLKQYLTVKYYETVESAGTTLDSTDYSLSGILVKGTSTIYASYGNLTTSFIVNGVVDFYDIWEWSYANGDFLINSATIDYYSNETHVRYTYRIPYDTRKTAVVTKGLLPFRVWGTDYESSGYYPIPIPPTANKVTIKITPSTQYIFLQVVNINNGNVDRLTQVGWTQGETSATFTAGENNAVFFNMKYDSAGQSYPTAPTEVVVTFEEV